MRFRKSAIILIAAVILMAAVLIFFDARLLEKIKQTSQTQDGPLPEEQTVIDGGTDTSGNAGPDEAPSENDAGTDDEASADELAASENVRVEYNTPEYDIRVMLCENTGEKTFLRLKYYVDGISTVHELYEEQIPELAQIFENRKGPADGVGGSQSAEVKDSNNSPYTISQALLNPVLGQLYLLINGAPLDTYTQSSFYAIDLYDVSVKKLFSYPARYGKMSFSSDFALLAYDFEDPPLMSMYREDSLFEVYSCTAGEYLVKGSRRQDQSLIGPDSDPGYIYDYTFEGWKASDTVKLVRASRPTNDAGTKPLLKEVIYNVITDDMTNIDGSKISNVNSGQGNDGGTGEGAPEGTDGNGKDNGTGTGGSENAAGGGSGLDPGSDQEAAEGIGSEPVKVLKDFYSYLGSENDYDKAMNLLDDGFILRLGMLRQFGIEEIYKSDIVAGYNQNNVSMYAQLLKAAKFERLVDVKISDDGSAVIGYYQTLGLGGDSSASQLMSAMLEKKDNVWMIKLIEDGIK